MSKLSIHSVDDKGTLDKECLWLEVLEDIFHLEFFLVCDTTFKDDQHISNELRHMFWFPKHVVKKGDWVRLFTKNGVAQTTDNNRNTKTHNFYWNLGKTVWNKGGDAAVVFEVAEWTSKRV